MTSSRADLPVKEETIEPVEFLGQGARALSVMSVLICLYLSECFECSEAITPPLHSVGFLFGPLLLLCFPNSIFISFQYKAQS